MKKFKLTKRNKVIAGVCAGVLALALIGGGIHGHDERVANEQPQTEQSASSSSSDSSQKLTPKEKKEEKIEERITKITNIMQESKGVPRLYGDRASASPTHNPQIMEVEIMKQCSMGKFDIPKSDPNYNKGLDKIAPQKTAQEYWSHMYSYLKEHGYTRSDYPEVGVIFTFKDAQAGEDDNGQIAHYYFASATTGSPKLHMHNMKYLGKE